MRPVSSAIGRKVVGGISPSQDIVDGGTARQYTGNDGEQTKNHQAGHNQPVPRADFFHVTTPMSAPKNVKRVIRELALRHAQRFR
jgi:hypothetical protein